MADTSTTCGSTCQRVNARELKAPSSGLDATGARRVEHDQRLYIHNISSLIFSSTPCTSRHAFSSALAYFLRFAYLHTAHHRPQSAATDPYHPGLQIVSRSDRRRTLLVRPRVFVVASIRQSANTHPPTLLTQSCSPDRSGHNVVVGRNGSGKSNFFSGELPCCEPERRLMLGQHSPSPTD